MVDINLSACVTMTKSKTNIIRDVAILYNSKNASESRYRNSTLYFKFCKCSIHKPSFKSLFSYALCKIISVGKATQHCVL